MALRKKKSTVFRGIFHKKFLHHKVSGAETVSCGEGAGSCGLSQCWVGRAHLGHVRQPVQDSENPFKVITNGAVSHPIVVHDLDAPKLVVRGIHFPPEDLEKQEKTFI